MGIGKLSALALATGALVCACADTLSPFNEKLTPARAQTTEPAHGEPAGPEAQPRKRVVHSPLTDKIVAHVRSLCQTRARGTIAAEYASDAVIRTAGAPDKKGAGAIADTWDAQSGFLGDPKCVGPRAFIKGGTAVVLGGVAGTSTGTFFGFKPTGKAIGVATATVDIFTPDGLIIEQHEYVDTPTLLAQLGVYQRETRGVTVPDGGLEVHVASGAPDEAANLRVVRSMQRALEKHDDSAYGAALGDDVVWDDFTAPAPAKGKPEVVKRFQATAAAFSNVFLECEPRAIEDYVVSECTMTGAHTGPVVVAGIHSAATNTNVTLHTLDVVQLQDGRVIRGWTYGNGAELARELGLWNPIAAPAAQGP